MARLGAINRAVGRFDRKLYAERRGNRIDIFREDYKYRTYDVDGLTLQALKPAPYHVISLTDNWNMFGTPVEWGILPILQKLSEIDLWKRDLVGEIESLYEKRKASEDRALQNNIEAFLYDYRRQFVRDFGEFNTSNLNKKKDRRYVDEKKLKAKGL